MIINNPPLLHEMMDDMKKSPEIYRPGNFWMFYVDKIAKDLEKKDLNQFRNWICGPGSIKSFGGGSDIHPFYYGWNIYPFDKTFKNFDESYIIKKFNLLINKFAQIHPFLGFLSFRGSIARQYFEGSISNNYKKAWLISKLSDADKILERVEDTKEGSPAGFEINKKFYTLSFLKEMMQIFFIEKKIKLKNLEVVLELGSGIGLKASTFLKVNPKITYIIVDIPPALYVAQQYLVAQNYKVFTYTNAKKIKSLKEINFNNYDVICLAPWMIDSIADISVDIFINVFSFQEMEPWLVKNYLEKILPITKKYVYLANEKEGHITSSKGKLGVLKKTKREDYINFLKPNFDLKLERDFTNINGINTDASEMIFEKVNFK